MKFRWLTNSAIIFSIALTGCGNTQSANDTAEQSAQAQEKADTPPEPDATVKTSAAPSSGDLDKDYQHLFNRAVLHGPWGEPAIVKAVLPAQGGMACSPSALDKDKPDFTLTLPEAADVRNNRLVAISPSGGVLTIYAPTKAAGQEVAPNTNVTWNLAKQQRVFPVSASAFDGLYIGETQPSGIFLEEGVYIFALVQGLGTDIRKADLNIGRTLYAACSVHWTP